jgi:hypothetical protein
MTLFFLHDFITSLGFFWGSFFWEGYAKLAEGEREGRLTSLNGGMSD